MVRGPVPTGKQPRQHY